MLAIRTQKLFTIAFICSVSVSHIALAVTDDPTYYSPQNLLIGATPTLQASANYGAGVTVGVIHTGGTKSWFGFNDGYGTIIGSTCISRCNNTALATGNTD